ncbi:MAG: 2,3,4,5-tetrahydropyridine-2,6-dicarboxylate N-acetyltransferase [Atopobiaceae bacterium]|jgi:2,3,4,5-tetrahydropyridine-2-carboxylate N-succinyltransferase/tetrahydrodipicolinate N-acetyltransferase|nr:2,3,4,5-tetrahydropyridine-2,6-dicarboxylate N-acetyltransferase [Atopobiaceae bacterium]
MSQEREMTAQEIIDFIANAEKATPVRVTIAKRDATVRFRVPGAHCFDCGPSAILVGDWADIEPVLKARAGDIADMVVDVEARNSAVPLLDTRGIRARIEPGAIIRDHVEIGDSAVIMMGAVINIGARIGEGTMIDMGAVLGGRATVGKHAHIGAGAVLAGVVEPASATPVIVEDDVLVGANAVVLEGVRVGRGAVVAAGAVVVDDVPAGAVVAGVPARVIKQTADVSAGKVSLVDALRTL